MTQNPWPQDGSLENPDTDQHSASGQASTLPPAQNPKPSESSSQGIDSKKDAAKDEAGNVARNAKDAAQNVTETAREEAGSVAVEAKSSARDLMEQAKADLSDQAGTQQQKVAEGLRSVSSELHSMVSASDQSGMATDLVRQAAERSSSVASWLDERDPGSLLDEVKSFARQKPGTFLLLAVGAGILAGRISRNLSADAPKSEGSANSATGTTAPKTPVSDTSTAPPSVPVAPPSPGAAGEPDTFPLKPSGAAEQAEVGQQEPWGAEPVIVTGPPKSVDPLGTDPFDGGHR
ncbi:hypothetical protein [Paeniglutamicibacter antarcticus]|uniref:F0F1-type ATP synthase membrane subunit b/b n=1 Tax=Paeniglutamicibacter antarcticus TaxID=494023 RepID=A0ABP9TMQ1_9MICC